MPSYGLLTNPSNDMISEIRKIHELNFDYVEIGIESPEGNPDIINKRRDEIVKLLEGIMTLYALGYRVISIPNAFLQYF